MTVETDSECSYFLSRDKQAELYPFKYIPVFSDSKCITDMYGFWCTESKIKIS